MNKKSKLSPITTQDYWGIFIILPIFIVIAAVAIIPFSSHIAGIVAKIGAGLLIFVVLYFVYFSIFGKKIVYKSKRREAWSKEELAARPHTRSYYADLIELAKTKGWSVKENGKTGLELKGIESGIHFTVYALYESLVNMHESVDSIHIDFPIIMGPKISITEGNLPGLLGENIINVLYLTNVTAMGENSSENISFLTRNRDVINQLIGKGTNNVRLMAFEAGTLSVELNSDSDEGGDTSLDLIIKETAKIATDYNVAFR